LTAMAIGLTARRSVGGVWREHFLPLLPSYFAAASVALLLAVALRVVHFGAIALILMLLLKIATLSLLPLWTAMAALVASHAFSRFCAVLVIVAGRYVGSADRSRSAPVVERVKVGDVVVAALFGLPALVLCGPRVIVAIVVALVLVGVLWRWCVQRIGGYTGDTLGATQQVAEIGCYVGLLGMSG